MSHIVNQKNTVSKNKGNTIKLSSILSKYQLSQDTLEKIIKVMTNYKESISFCRPGKRIGQPVKIIISVHYTIGDNDFDVIFDRYIDDHWSWDIGYYTGESNPEIKIEHYDLQTQLLNAICDYLDTHYNGLFISS